MNIFWVLFSSPSFHPWRSRGAPSLWRASPPGSESSGPPPPGENISNIFQISQLCLPHFWQSELSYSGDRSPGRPSRELFSPPLSCNAKVINFSLSACSQSESLHLCSTQFLPFLVASGNVNSSVTRVSSLFVLTLTTLTAKINFLIAVNCRGNQAYRSRKKYFSSNF